MTTPIPQTPKKKIPLIGLIVIGMVVLSSFSLGFYQFVILPAEAKGLETRDVYVFVEAYQFKFRFSVVEGYNVTIAAGNITLTRNGENLTFNGGNITLIKNTLTFTDTLTLKRGNNATFIVFATFDKEDTFTQHGFFIPEFMEEGAQIDRGKIVTVNIVFNKPSTSEGFLVLCTIFCGTGHGGMRASILVT